MYTVWVASFHCMKLAFLLHFGYWAELKVMVTLGSPNMSIK